MPVIAALIATVLALLPPLPPLPTDPPPGVDVRLGPAFADYQDTELLDGVNLMSFTDTPERKGWLARIDPVDGTFLSADGHDLLVDSDIATFGETLNGLDFGLDAAGWSVFYTKPDAGGSVQVWRASPDPGGDLVGQQLTSGLPHHTTLARKDAGTSSVALGGMQGPTDGGDIVVWDEDHPSDIKIVGPRELGTQLYFFPGAPRFMTLLPDLNGERQFHVGDLATGATVPVTSDPGDKRDGGLWFAPEFGSVVAATIVGDKTIGVYAPAEPSELTGAWERVQTLPLPSGSLRRMFKSPEPFVVGGRSYLAVGLHDSRLPFGIGEIWVMPIGGGEPTRCDANGPRNLFEPEALVVGDRAFIYYTDYKPFPGSGAVGAWEAWRCIPQI